MARETVCLVFTDLVGSTELANRIGPGQAEVLRKEHFGLLRVACSDAGGREIKNLGDGLMLAFGSASAALDAAASAQRAIATRNRRAEVRFDVRIGIAFGEVDAEDGDYFGEPVVQAARLCAVAEGGQVLLTDLVKVLANATTHGFTTVGEIELKGLPAPVLVHALVWEAAGAEVMPLPTRLRGAPEALYVGRDGERSVLQQAWKRATEGEESLLLVAGEPGIGKTRLSSHHAFEVHEAGGVVLYGAIDEGVGVPYQAWIEALSHYVSSVDDAMLDRCLASAGADLARLLPALRRRRPDLPLSAASDGETERYLLFEAVTEVLRVASRQAPVLVIIDDLHWADQPTLHLLMHLHRSLSDSTVQLIGTYRDSELSPEHPLADTLAKLHREERVTRLTLAGLGEAEITELLRFASGQDMTPAGAELARVLVRDTAGNPLFVSEVLRDLLESGQIAITDDGGWGLATDAAQLPTPSSVRSVVEQRVLRLGPDAQRLLSAAAVIGREFELDLLAAVTGLDADTSLDVIEAAIAGSLVTEAGSRPGVFRFVHALIAQALLDGLSATRRAALHHHVGEAIEELHGDSLGERVTALARHQLLAGDDPIKVAHSCRRAGAYALGALAPDEAIRWFQSSLDAFDRAAVDDPLMRCDLQTDIGIAMRAAGDPNHRGRLTEAARSASTLGDGERLGRPLIALQSGVAISVGTADDELIALMDEALRLSSQPTGIRAMLLALRAAEAGVAARLAAKRALVDEAVAIARDLDAGTYASVLISAIGAIYSPRTLDERRQYDTELRRISATGDPSHRAYSAIYALNTALEEGDRNALDAEMAEAREACIVLPYTKWVYTVTDSVYHRVNGDLLTAERLAEQALELALSSGNESGLPTYAVNVSDIRQTQGRAGELVELLQQAHRDNPALRPILRSTLVAALLQAGRFDDALSLLEDAHREGFENIPEGVGWITSINDYSTAASRCARPDAAALLYPMALPFANRMVATPASFKGAVSTTLGILAGTLGDRDAAIEHFATADRQLEQFRAPLGHARNSYEHARALLELGDPADRARARDLLNRAREAYDRHDCPVQVANCDELLAPIQ